MKWKIKSIEELGVLYRYIYNNAPVFKFLTVAEGKLCATVLLELTHRIRSRRIFSECKSFKFNKMEVVALNVILPQVEVEDDYEKAVINTLYLQINQCYLSLFPQNNG
jgi:hypothetical protein